MKTLTGKVIKNQEATATVAVERIFAHPLYGKRIKKVKKYQVQDEKGVNVGNFVVFAETRPLSKNKRWKILEVLK